MEKFKLELKLITPAFCGGATPDKQAEIRVPSIRGQLRWWFRVLGGFKSLSHESVKEQENMIFGTVSGNARASRLILRVKQLEPGKPLISSVVKNAEELGADQNTDLGYFLFPLRSNPKKKQYNGKALFEGDRLPSFELTFLWKGQDKYLEDIKALGAVFGHLGSLGFRSRRAMGALSFAGDSPDLNRALNRFSNPNGVIVKSLGSFPDANASMSSLARWLKGWRSHGRSPDLSNGPGFEYARNDHDAGLGNGNNTFRPAIGLPIIQRFSSIKKTVSWEEAERRGEGRFASPVILKPYLDSNNCWKSLVIFVESMKWPSGKKVYIDGKPKDVSLDLYEAMKNDQNLGPFTA